VHCHSNYHRAAAGVIRINRYICIHGHFYQPPRENPWLEEIETEESAYPFHDWNERITAECYAPNASSRILGEKKTIIDIVNNYARISFNFGPTLLSWLEKSSPDVYALILQADRESRKRYSGHGSAIAQIYNHIIMPLATSEDKETEVIWGIRDFTTRFNRIPEGMWLSETAVDYETLQILADQEIRFTILDPNQAKRFRDDSHASWADIKGGAFDISRPYLCHLPGGGSIAIFFYDHTLANEIAFGELLNNGEVFANRMISSFSGYSDRPRILSIANDGETYGHHHRFGDMALSYALHLIESKNQAKITIFGEYLEMYPPVAEVEIRENTSWSCPHGISRWRENCGCRTYYACLISDRTHCRTEATGKKPERDTQSWNQQWRSPLREAMNWLSEKIAEIYHEKSHDIFPNPAYARNEYIDLILNRSDESVDWFFSRTAESGCTRDQRVSGLKLLEMRRNALLMFTSCGWFFDEISGIETVQVMKYACRAMQLARELTGDDLEPEYIRILAGAKSNVPSIGTGADIYTAFVRNTIVDISRVAFYYAITSLIEPFPEESRLAVYTIRRHAHRQEEAGFLRLVTGQVFIRSEITRIESMLVYAALHIGDHNFMGGVGQYTSAESFTMMESELWEAFARSDIPDLILTLNRHFESHSYSLWDLPHDGRRRVLYSILDKTLSDIESEYRQIYCRYFTLIRAMKEMQIPPPEALEYPVRYILNHDINQNLKSPNVDLTRLETSVAEMKHGKYTPDIQTLNYITSACISWYLQKIALDPEEITNIRSLNKIFSILKPWNLNPDIWESQNEYFRIHSAFALQMHQLQAEGDAEAEEWIREFDTLGANLGVRGTKDSASGRILP